MSYTNVVKKQDIVNFIDSLEVVYNDGKEEIAIENKQFIEEFIYEFSKYLESEIPHIYILDVEGMKEKKPFYTSSKSVK